jgi:PST family polysaccharide transporter
MLIEKVKHRFSNQFVRNVSWLGGAEIINRVCRLVTVIFLARLLSPQDYGLAAIVLTTNEFANVFTLKSGISSKLIQASEKDFSTLCDTAYWMNWIFSILLFLIQCIVAFPIAWFYKDNQIILPICVTATVYLTLPLFAIQAAILTRENRLKVTALCNGLQGVVGNLSTVIFACLGLGMWAIVLPIVLVYPIWVIVNRMSCKWRPTKPFTLYRWQEIAGFAGNILGVELLNKLRANLDYLLVGRFLGIEALGIYYFAFNAGIGISLNVINAFTWSIFPHICAVKNDFEQCKQRYFSSLKNIAIVVLPLVLLQSTLAPFYVPILYGQKWIEATPILVLICLSALPRPFAEAASMLLQAIDKTNINLYWNLIFTVILGVLLIVAVNWGIVWVAASVLIAHGLCLPIFTIWAGRYAFSITSAYSLIKEET